MNKDRFRKAIEEKYDDFIVEKDYGDLWLELEPRLSKKRNKKLFLWLIFGMFLLLSGSIFVSLNKDDSIKPIDKLTMKNSIVDSKIVIREDNYLDSNNKETKEKISFVQETEIAESKNVAQLETKEKIESSINRSVDLIVNEFNSNQVVDHREYINRVAVAIDNDLSNQQIGLVNNLALSNAKFITRGIIYETKYDDVRKTPVLSDLTINTKLEESWTVDGGITLLFPSWKQQNYQGMTNYSNLLNQRLKLENGIRFSLGFQKTIKSGIYWGGTLSYSEIYEKFEIDNRIEIDKLEENNKYALKYNNYYIASKQTRRVYKSQDVLKYNKLKLLDVAPYIGYEYTGKFAFNIDFSPLFTIYEDYRGYLVDKNDLVIERGDIFDNSIFMPIGFRIKSGLGIPLSDQWSLNTSLTYEQRGMKKNNVRGLEGLEIFGISLGIGYNIR